MLESYNDLSKYGFEEEFKAADKEMLQYFRDEMYWIDPDDKKAKPIIGLGFVAQLFQEMTISCLKYNRTSGTWWTYEKGCWHDSGTSKIATPVQNFGKAMKSFGLKNSEFREAFVKIGTQIGGVPKAIKEVCDLLKSTDLGAFNTSDLDQEDDLLNLKNACFNLKTMKLMDQNPVFMLSKQCNVEYDPEAKCPRWIQFINEVTVDEEGKPQPEKVEYLQKLLGLCLTANSDNEFFHIFYGATTRNGKTTLVNVITEILGSYAAYVPADSFDSKTKIQPNAPRTDLVAMAGARVVVVGEPKRDMRFEASIIKQITGRSPIPVRRLHEATWNMRCQCKLILDSNYLPKVTDETLFTSSRIRIIPFEKHFETSEQDPQLHKKLEAEYSGIFNWMLEGLKKYYDSIEMNRGISNELLPVIDCMKDYSEAYEDDFRRVEKFVNAVVEENGIDTFTTDALSDYNCIKVDDLFDNYYKGWCKDENISATLGRSNFKKEIAKSFKGKGYREDCYIPVDGKRKHLRNVLVGYKLKEESDRYQRIGGYY